MKCPSCGVKGQHDGKAPPGEAKFEFRGRLGARVILRCLNCDGGVFARMAPPGQKAIPPEEWQRLEEFWQLRRAEILADLQAQQEFGPNVPVEERVQETQRSFVGETSARMALIHVLNQAGYGSAEAWSDLMKNDPARFALYALAARQRNVIHDDYDTLLAQGGMLQTPAAEDRIAAAAAALSAGDDAVSAFLAKPATT